MGEAKQVKITSQKTEYFAKTANTYGTLLELCFKDDEEK
jgi:hypothetical protein